MNEGSSFRSLQQLVSSVQTNLEMSGDHSVGAIGPIFDPNAQVGSQDSQIAGGLPGAKPYRTFVWVDDIAQVSQNPTLAPDGKKVKFDQRLCGDAMVAHLKREIPEITATRWVRQFSTNMVYILSAPHQRENGDWILVSATFLRKIFFIHWISWLFWTNVPGAALIARFYVVNSTGIPPQIDERVALVR